METRICAACREVKSFTDFKRYRGWCKPCVRNPDTATLVRNRDAVWLQQYREGARHPWPGEWPFDETWRAIHGYVGLYEASDQGRIRSLWFGNLHMRYVLPVPRVLSQHRMSCGYLAVRLNDVTALVHRLVLLAFLGPPPDGYQAGHWDGNNFNNRLENLEWITPVQNSADRIRHGTQPYGERCGAARLTAEQVREMRRLYRPRKHGSGSGSIARAFNVNTSTAYRILSGQTWKHV